MKLLQNILTVIAKAIKPRRKLHRIVSSFDKTVNDLRKLRRAHNVAIDRHYDKITSIRAEINVLDAEATRAENIATNIERLLI
jgi:prefoldin subunit 5